MSILVKILHGLWINSVASIIYTDCLPTVHGGAAWHASKWKREDADPGWIWLDHGFTIDNGFTIVTQ